MISWTLACIKAARLTPALAEPHQQRRLSDLNPCKQPNKQKVYHPGRHYSKTVPWSLLFCKHFARRVCLQCCSHWCVCVCKRTCSGFCFAKRLRCNSYGVNCADICPLQRHVCNNFGRNGAPCTAMLLTLLLPCKPLKVCISCLAFFNLSHWYLTCAWAQTCLTDAQPVAAQMQFAPKACPNRTDKVWKL